MAECSGHKTRKVIIAIHKDTIMGVTLAQLREEKDQVQSQRLLVHHSVIQILPFLICEKDTVLVSQVCEGKLQHRCESI